MPACQCLEQSKQKPKQETQTWGCCQPAGLRKGSKGHCSKDLFETKAKPKKKKKSLVVTYKRFRELFRKEKLNPKSAPNDRNSYEEKFFVQRAEKKDSCVTKPLSPAFHQSENTSLTVNVYIMIVFYQHLIFLILPSLVSRHCDFHHCTVCITCLSIVPPFKYSSSPSKPSLSSNNSHSCPT